jgi:hypothetical protein
MKQPPKKHKLLGQILIEINLLNEANLAQALRIQAEKGGLLGKVLIEAGFITEENLLRTLATQYNMPVVDITQAVVAEDALKMVSASMARVYRVVPLSFKDILRWCFFPALKCRAIIISSLPGRKYKRPIHGWPSGSSIGRSADHLRARRPRPRTLAGGPSVAHKLCSVLPMPRRSAHKTCCSRLSAKL